jgi:hypothetical protein
MFKFELQIDPAQVARVRDGIVSDVLGAATDALRVTTRQLERELEDITRRAVKGNSWRAWASSVYPRSGAARAPVGEVFVKGGRRSRGMMSFWTTPGVNRSKDGYWLAVPLPAAGARGRSRDLTPGEWERRTGVRLQYVHRNGDGYAMLVAEGVLAGNGSGVLRRPSDLRRKLDVSRTGQARARKTVPIFLLIPFQRHANRVSVEPAITRARAGLARAIDRNLAALGR